jgi:hypothetical protein
MKIRAIGAIALGFALAGPGAAMAQSAKDLVGTWKNTGNVNIAADGKRTDNFGPKGTGMVIFGADGHFVVVNINPETPKFAANSRTKGTADENKAGMAGGIGLFGTYKVSGKTIEMKVDGSTYPNWTGTAQTRNLTAVTANELKWTLVSSVGGTSEITWTRMK